MFYNMSLEQADEVVKAIIQFEDFR